MSSSESSSSSGDGNGVGGRVFEAPSSSRRRSNNGVWPEPFLEALASQVAIDASRTIGRLAAAPALANLFQVCSTWRAVSRSNLLWRQLTRRIWSRTVLLHNTWHEEYIYRHRTAYNFRIGRSSHATLIFDAADIGDNENGLSCRCLTLSDFHLACGFTDGAVRLFDLTTRLYVTTFWPQHRDRLGQFSSAVSGIIIVDNSRLVFATLDGDIHVAIINDNAPPRRAHLGEVVNDGALVDFTGCNRWWVGLYAGVPGRAIHIWDGESEELMFVGGSLTDPEAVMGWHMLTELTEFVGRVRITGQESAVACTSLRVLVFDLRNQGVVLGDEEFRRGIIVGTFDASNQAYIVVDGRGVASVRRVGTLEEVCRFTVRGASQRVVLGSINGGYAIVCVGGVTRVWEVEEHGVYLYSFRERIGQPNAMVANDSHVAVSSSDGMIHLWDFGAQ